MMLCGCNDQPVVEGLSLKVDTSVLKMMFGTNMLSWLSLCSFFWRDSQVNDGSIGPLS